MNTARSPKAQAAYDAGFRAGNAGVAEPMPAEHATDRAAYDEGYLAGLDAAGTRMQREFRTPLRYRW